MKLHVFNGTTRETMDTTFEELIAGYESLKAISFVGSFKMINDLLLSTFYSVRVVLGKEDDATGNRLKWDMERAATIADELESLDEDDEFLNRLEEETLQMRFTKDRLIHSKLYILERECEFRILVGSANLTNKAMNENVEELIVFDGFLDERGTELDRKTYAAYGGRFDAVWRDESVEFIDRKLIPDFRGASRDTIYSILIGQQIDDITSKRVTYRKEDVVSFAFEETPKYRLEEVEREVGAIQSLFKKNGQAKANLKEETVKAIRVAVSDAGLKTVTPNFDEEKVNPDQIIRYSPEDHEFVEFESEDDTQGQALRTQPVTATDLDIFNEMLRSYSVNKVEDESDNLLTILLYTMTSPLIWRVRQIVHENRGSRETIPNFMAILGAGNSGKTKILQYYIRPFIGLSNDQRPFDVSNVKHLRGLGYGGMGGNGPVTNFVQYNMSKGDNRVSPLIIDEVPDSWLSNKTAGDMIKATANSFSGINPAVIMSSNDTMSGLSRELQKRVLYVSISSPFKPESDCEIDFISLSDRINDHLFKETIKRLNQMLINPTDEIIKGLKSDPMWATRVVVKQIFDELGVEPEVELDGNYSFRKVKAAREWNDRFRMAAQARQVLTSYATPDEFTITIEAFKSNNQRGAAANQDEMSSFAALLNPQIIKRTTKTGLTLYIDAFDEYLGEQVARSYWRERHVEEIAREENRGQINQANETMDLLAKTLLEQQKQLQELAEVKKPKGFRAKLQSFFG